MVDRSRELKRSSPIVPFRISLFKGGPLSSYARCLKQRHASKKTKEGREGALPSCTHHKLIARGNGFCFVKLFCSLSWKIINSMVKFYLYNYH